MAKTKKATSNGGPRTVPMPVRLTPAERAEVVDFAAALTESTRVRVGPSTAAAALIREGLSAVRARIAVGEVAS